MNEPCLPTRRHVIAAGAATLMLPGLGRVAHAAADDAALAAAVAGPQRSAANRARDAHRHPLETLRFFGVAPDHTVLEIAPGGGWFTEILAPYLRQRGRLVAAHYPAEASESYLQARVRFADKLAQTPAAYDRVVVTVLERDARRATPALTPASFDHVLTFRNVHNWIEAKHFDDALGGFFSLLKPGGVLGVEDHRALPGRTLADTIASGYVPEEFVIERARAAGFQLAARSEVNANPKDTREHPDGVWSLPPTLRGGEKDRARFVAIGESDRMTLRFVKPRA